MSTSSDLMVGDTFKDKVYLVETATGNPHLLQTPTCTIIDESGNRAAGVVAEESDGWYTCNFSPDASGTWSTEWANVGSTIYFGTKIFRVGQTAIHIIDAFHDVPAQNAVTNSQIRDVVGNKTDVATAAVFDNKSLVAYAKGIINHLGNFAGRANGDITLLDVLGVPDVANKDLYTCLITDRLDNATYGLSALETLVDGLETRLSNTLITRTWFSASQEEVALTGGAGDKTLPSVTLPNITGTIVHVYAGFKFRMIENTNAAANKLNGAQDIQVRVDTPGAWADAINFVDDQFGLAASTREGGDCIIGSIDLVGTVTAFNDVYEFQWDEAVADQANLQFNDVQTFLIVSYY